jgi:hypothetical protein
VTPLFVELARKATSEPWGEEHGQTRMRQMLSTYFQVAKPERRAIGEVQEDLYAELSPVQVVSLQHFLAAIRRTGNCVLVTGLDEMLTAFSGAVLEADTIKVLAEYLAARGVLVFSSDTTFEWFYARLLRPLVVEVGLRWRLLEGRLVILSGGKEIFAFEDGPQHRFADLARGYGSFRSSVLAQRPSGGDDHVDHAMIAALECANRLIPAEG